MAAAKLSIGALEISVLVGTFLYAITCAQIYVYWRSNFNDRFVIRLLVRLFTLVSISQRELISGWGTSRLRLSGASSSVLMSSV